MVRLEAKTNGIKATAFNPETAMRDVDKLREHFDVYDKNGNLKKGKQHVTIDDLGALCKDMKTAIMTVKYSTSFWSPLLFHEESLACCP